MSFLLRPFGAARDDDAEAADMADSSVIQVRSPAEAGEFLTSNHTLPRHMPVILRSGPFANWQSPMAGGQTLPGFADV